MYITSGVSNLLMELDKLKSLEKYQDIEERIRDIFESSPDALEEESGNFNSCVNRELYKFILKHYRYGEGNICFWRFIKNISKPELELDYHSNPDLNLMDSLIKIFFYSDPLDDLTCLFIPISEADLIEKYLRWIKHFFYNANYPTSLLWLYALDSSMANIFPEEILFLGKTVQSKNSNILIPDFTYADSVLIKRYGNSKEEYSKIFAKDANIEFRQIFNFLHKEFEDRCLSHSIKDQSQKAGGSSEWEKFSDVLGFGVSDKSESGTVSFSDLRSSTDFLNFYGKSYFRNKIQSPFFEQTKLITNLYHGRIDKFMGDNVMCVFLSKNIEVNENKSSVLMNFFAVFKLCRVLLNILQSLGLSESKLGLRSGVTFGENILRSNLGNDIVRDFTVTGEAVNLAARLEHFSIQELVINLKKYFSKEIERFPRISELLKVIQPESINEESKELIQKYTLYQNILSNLDVLENARFDIRMNHTFYEKLSEHLISKGYTILNSNSSDLYGYDEYNLEGFTIKAYYSFYNPKGFNKFEKVWVIPFSEKFLIEYDIDKLA